MEKGGSVDLPRWPARVALVRVGEQGPPHHGGSLALHKPGKAQLNPLLCSPSIPHVHRRCIDSGREERRLRAIPKRTDIVSILHFFSCDLMIKGERELHKERKGC